MQNLEYEKYLEEVKQNRANQKAGAFRIQAKNFFLTYPLVPGEDSTKELVLAEMKRIFSDSKYILVAKENYKDNSHYHFHAVVVCEHVRHFRKQTFADISVNTPNNGKKTKHGNYASAKYLMKAIDYAKKDGDFIEDGVSPVYNTGKDGDGKAVKKALP